MRHVILTILLFFWIVIAFAQLTGKVVGVHDGDSFTLLTANNTQYKIRLNGIDCPELKQDFGNVAKQFTSSLIFGKFVTVQTEKKDRYGRMLGVVVLENGKVLNEELLRYGYAWHFKKYNNNSKWAKLEINARKNKLGLWKQTNPIAPWDYRKAKKHK
jgi:micrococcal nuclease